MVVLFDRTIKYILSNYIPHETIFWNNQDPLWTNNNRAKELINKENNIFRKLSS